MDSSAGGGTGAAKTGSSAAEIAVTGEQPAKNHLREMRAMGIRGLLVYCSEYKCSHNVEISAVALK
jgi:hypothetical protein